MARRALSWNRNSFSIGPNPPDEPRDVLEGIQFGPILAAPHMITSRFDAPRTYANGKHEGLDLDKLGGSADNDDAVLSVYPGTVERVRHSSGAYGKYVIVRHVYRGTEFKTWYCHMDETYVHVGDTVSRGQAVGEIGGTGGFAEHIHLNVQVPGHGLSGYVIPDVVDPKPYLPVNGTPPPSSSKVRMGLHASGGGGDLQPVEIQEFRILDAEIVKVLSSTSAHSIQLLESVTPNADIWVIRAFLKFNGRNISPQQFYNDTQGDVMRSISALLGVGYNGQIIVELHNEPNLTDEGWGTTWNDGREFASWLAEVTALYRQRVPAGVKLAYPGLSPGAPIPGIRYDHDTFLAQSKNMIAPLDAVCVHAYWSQGWPIGTAVNQVRGYTTFGKQIVVSEASRNDPTRIVSDEQYANEYVQFCNLLGNVAHVDGVTYFISHDLGFSSERWIDGSDSRGIAAAIRS